MAQNNSCNHPSRKPIVNEIGVQYYQCNDCKKRLISVRRRLGNLWLLQRFYQSRGASYTGWLMGLMNMVQTGGILVLLLSPQNSKPAIWVFIIAWLLQQSFETWWGYKDYTKYKLAQTEGLLGLPYSPYALEVLKRIKKIERAVSHYPVRSDYTEESVTDMFKDKKEEEKQDNMGMPPSAYGGK